MWKTYVTAGNLDDVPDLLAKYGGKARIIAGGTDLMLEMERGQRKGIEILIDISRIQDQDYISMDEDFNIHLGPLVTHNHCVSSKLIREYAWPLAQAAWQVGSPQIRNRGTVAGNLITASPANDTISPLMALGAVLTLKSASGVRNVAIKDFYTGVRRTIMKPDEMLVDISFPALRHKEKGIFLKFALRKAQAISLVNLCMILDIQNDLIQSAKITLGAVAPTIISAVEAEKHLEGKNLDEINLAEVEHLVEKAARPIDDLRSSSDYRQHISRILMRRGLRIIKNRMDQQMVPESPVVLWGKNNGNSIPPLKFKLFDENLPIKTQINGKSYEFENGHHQSLLRLLRDEGMLTGTKEGCAEGECGACTIFLDGKAVMACLVPAPRADGAEIRTIEGLSEDGKLNPVQKAFVEEGAVQCGYCTPGFVMSATKLLEEKPHPTKDEIRQAVTGNLCRCTGYYKIISAIEKASLAEESA